jgi:hypothetical protein
VVLEGCYKKFSEYICNSQVAVAKISTTTSFNHENKQVIQQKVHQLAVE